MTARTSSDRSNSATELVLKCCTSSLKVTRHAIESAGVGELGVVNRTTEINRGSVTSAP